jgi:hypothetical protein
MTKINQFIPFREIIAVYSENYMKPTNKLCGQNAEFTVKARGLCTSHWALKG